MNPEVDLYIRRERQWPAEMRKLRGLLLECGLAEEIKWGKPCYTRQGSNLCIIQGFKHFCALLFCKGALLRDPHHLLEKPGASTQGARRILFTNVAEIEEKSPMLKAYILEAIAAEKAGLEVVYKKKPEPIPAELKKKLAELPALKAAFHALTPGRQRGYILYFGGAKQARTREQRIEKYIKRILAGRGFHD